ncbi:hypothetical protein [Domibacillus aminovorans]|uniref:Uncharacterized protein n=1 Tax=Domibacillus aminovorans TaxID=29332 RepID=A0A177KZY8_9BACI|nr:hypothetical protein [Domibacillus aminovorans]OAH58950.1 hypothetical protein AWH49_04605 [Domibacillus aminovorans]
MQKQEVTLDISKPRYSKRSNGRLLFDGGDVTAEFPREYNAGSSYSYNESEHFRMLTVDLGDMSMYFFAYTRPVDETPDDFTANDSMETLIEHTKEFGEIGLVIRYRIDANDDS